MMILTNEDVLGTTAIVTRLTANNGRLYQSLATMVRRETRHQRGTTTTTPVLQSNHHKALETRREDEG